MEREFLLDDGTKEYTIRNTFGEIIAKFRFNALETGIIERYKELSKEFTEIVFDENSNADTIVTLDHKIIDLFSRLLNRDVSVDIFGNIKPLTATSNGDFFCEKVLELIGTIIEGESGERLEAKKSKIKKATKKYIH